MQVVSRDGTKIDYDVQGHGPAVILVYGALGTRALGFSDQLRDLLSSELTVYSYDRRGRGKSGDTLPYAVDREIEDIEALIDEAGGKAALYGLSSGACLCLEAAIKLGEKVDKLGLFEPPYDSDKSAVKPWHEYRSTIAVLIHEHKNAEAIAEFMRFLGVPDGAIEGMKQAPNWSLFEAAAPTLEYDAACMGPDRAVPEKRSTAVTADTLVMDGSKSLEVYPFMSKSADLLAKSIPHVKRRTLEGQGHDVSAEALAPVLLEFMK